MKHTVIVINGKGGVGKDTLCDIAGKHYRTRNVSSVAPIKKLASLCGWNGEKDDRSRKFLSDLKALTAEYNDFPTRWLREQYEEFCISDEEVMFVHIREGSEIDKFLDATGGRAVTLLVRGGKRMPDTRYGNDSDDLVEAYKYDYYFTNDLPLDKTEEAFCDLLRNIIDKNGF